MTPAPSVIPPPAENGRWRIYLSERFSLRAHGPLVLAFAGGVVCASGAILGSGWPALTTVGLVFVAVLGFFFQLRVADEWKDAETDRLYRPERPVPRGLVTLRELSTMAALVAVVQLAVTFAVGPRLLVPLAIVWAYGLLMSFEFFARGWLRRNAFATLVSHGLIVPLIAYYAASAEAVARGAELPPSIGWLLATSFFAGNVVEFGRKLLAPEDERPGVETYSGLWGSRAGAGVYGGAALLSAGCAAATWVAVPELAPNPAVVWIVAGLFVSPVLVIVGRYASRPTAESAGAVQTASGTWALGVYLVLGPGALLASV